jgi:hypothetical protein
MLLLKDGFWGGGVALVVERLRLTRGVPDQKQIY